MICNQRRQTEQRRGRKATRVSNQARAPDRVAIGFREPVNKLRLRVHSGVWLFVVFLENSLIAQAEVSGEIDRFNVSRQARNNVHRLSMRKRQEDAVDTVEFFWR